MGKTLNLTDAQARIVHHLAENELQAMAAGSVPEDDEYQTDLEAICDKAGA